MARIGDCRIAPYRTAPYLAGMSKCVMVIAMLLFQVQPVIGAVLCEQHHAVMEHDCGHGTDPQGSTSHHSSQQSPDQDNADHCASAAACTSVARMFVAEAVPFFAADVPTDVPPAAGMSAPAEWFHAAPFHPPKA